MATLKDVAKHSGMSVTTVSRVLNDSALVDPETRRRVEDAMRALNYVPNENARRLKINRSNVLGVVVPDITNPFFANVVRGIESAASVNGYTVLFCNSNFNENMEREAVALLSRQKVAGIVSASVASDRAAQEIYGTLETRVVFVDNIPNVDCACSSVVINNAQAARELTNLLLSRGRRNICMIGGPMNETSSADRFHGCLRALEARGLTLDERNFRLGDNRVESGERMMGELLAQGLAPDAVIAANNFMAYGAMKAIMAQGLAVPEDVTIATFDVVDYTGLVKEKFLSVIQPTQDIGRISAEICMAEAKPDTAGGHGRIVLEHTIE